jgi:hypothetical protein
MAFYGYDIPQRAKNPFTEVGIKIPIASWEHLVQLEEKLAQSAEFVKQAVSFTTFLPHFHKLCYNEDAISFLANVGRC